MDEQESWKEEEEEEEGKTTQYENKKWRNIKYDGAWQKITLNKYPNKINNWTANEDVK